MRGLERGGEPCRGRRKPSDVAYGARREADGSPPRTRLTIASVALHRTDTTAHNRAYHALTGTANRCYLRARTSPRGPVFRRIAPIAFSAALAGFALAPAPAMAADVAEPTWFENDVLHFAPDDDVFVTTTRVRAPEGPVDVITVRPRDPISGEVSGPSFVTLTVFRTALPGDGTPAENARDTLLNGALSALHGADVSVSDRAITLDGHDVDARRLSISLDGTHATATVGAAEQDGVVVVYFDQRQGADSVSFEGLNSVGRTFAFGPAPEPVEEAEDTPEEHADDHGDDHGEAGGH